MDLLLGTMVLRPYVFAFLAVFLVAGAVDLGRRRVLAFAACVWPVAWLAEFSSTRTGIPFGLYTYTQLTRGRADRQPQRAPPAQRPRSRDSCSGSG